MVVASYTQTGIEYEVTLQDGLAVRCQCGDHTYRHKTCKHMIVANSMVQAEIDRAETFLALKSQIEKKEREARETAASYMRIFYAPW